MYSMYHSYVRYDQPLHSSASGMDYQLPCIQSALQLVRTSVQGEREDEMFYQYLISIAPNEEEKEIISSIRDDERKHNQMFRKIYRDFTGEEVQSSNSESFEKPKSYLHGIRKALFGELKAVEKYRIIHRCLPQQVYRDMLFEIITDELKHAAKYNYLFSLNK